MGVNPYKVDLDTFDYTAGKTNEERFRGYKYSPLLPVVYFPGVRLFGNVGILLLNTMIPCFYSIDDCCSMSAHFEW
jgi:hypothetical protein